MGIRISAACGCSIGRIRANNEDNLCFDGMILSEDHTGLRDVVKLTKPSGTAFFGVFDGMGGERFGEKAAFAAAKTAKDSIGEFMGNTAVSYADLMRLCTGMNRAVCEQQKMLLTDRMGTTAAMLLFVPGRAFACNLGDSRIYRLRGGVLSKVSVDDLERVPEGVKRKPGLTQFLGIPEDLMSLEPHMSVLETMRDDVYLIASDGLTDMVSDREICSILMQHISVKKSAQHLIARALQNGGRDNVTVIAVRAD